MNRCVKTVQICLFPDHIVYLIYWLRNTIFALRFEASCADLLKISKIFSETQATCTSRVTIRWHYRCYSVQWGFPFNAWLRVVTLAARKSNAYDIWQLHLIEIYCTAAGDDFCSAEFSRKKSKRFAYFLFTESNTDGALSLERFLQVDEDISMRHEY